MPNTNLKFSKAMKRVSPFRVMTVMDRASALEEQGEKVIHMEVGEPDFTTASPILNAAKMAIDNGKTQYTLAPGIMELRERAKAELGNRFDIKDFHSVVLMNGILPLTVLEALVDQYIKENS